MSVSAELARQQDPDRHKPERHPEAQSNDIDVEKLVLDAVNQGRKIDINVAESITAASLARTMEGASSVSITITDPRRALLRSDLWDYSIDININGHGYRLAQVEKAGDDLTLTAEDRIIAFLRRHDDAQSVSRGKMTRAEFIRHLVRKVHAQDVKFYSPELHKQQPIAKSKNERDRQDTREPGLEGSTKVKAPPHKKKVWRGKPIPHGPGGQHVHGTIRQTLVSPAGRLGRPQLFVAEQILDTGYSMGMNHRILLSALMVAGVETELGETRNKNSYYVGVFQQDPKSGGKWPATGKTVPDAKGYFKIAKQHYNANPGMSLVELGLATQSPGDPDYGSKLKSWQPTAKKLLEEYGATGGDTSQTYRQRFSFTVGPPDGPKGENYWEAITRLADQVDWRVFINGNTFYYVADRDLINSKPRMVIDEDSDGVDAIDFDWDVGKRNNEATVACRAARWFAPPGSVVKLENCGPADGRWLVNRIERDLYSTDTTITLHRVVDPKKEPPAQLGTRTNDQVEARNGARGIVEEAFRIAREAGGSSVYVGSDYRKDAVTTSGNPSDHSENNWRRAARDIGKHGVDLIVGPPSHELDLAAVAIGKAFHRGYKLGQTIDADTFQWGHYRVQVIWRTPKYGGHMGHVHVGAHLNSSVNDPGHKFPALGHYPGKSKPRYGGGAGATP